MKPLALALALIIGFMSTPASGQELDARDNTAIELLSAAPGLQLQPARPRNDHKKKWIVIGIVATAAVVWLIYEVAHSGGTIVVVARP